MELEHAGGKVVSGLDGSDLGASAGMFPVHTVFSWTLAGCIVQLCLLWEGKLLLVGSELEALISSKSDPEQHKRGQLQQVRSVEGRV